MTLYYFDHAASAPRRDVVTEAMAPWTHGIVGNPSGSHRAARAARRALEEARDEVAHLVGAPPSGVIFTAGGTESCTLAVLGTVAAHANRHPNSQIIVSQIEHHAVLDAAELAQREYEAQVHYAGVDGDGVIDIDDVIEHLRVDTALVSVMSVNNETGVIEPLGAVVEALRTANYRGVTHTDAVAAAPWLDLAVATQGVDAVTICAHKLGGPVNSGALVMRRELPIDARSPGGGQERGFRGGTVDVAAAVGLATALRVAANERDDALRRARRHYERLSGALSTLPGAAVSAASARRVPGTLHLTFEGVSSDELLFLLDVAGVCASAASSCSSGATQSSHVLAAMAMAPSRAKGSLRLSFGGDTSDDEVEAVILAVRGALERLQRGRSRGELAD